MVHFIFLILAISRNITKFISQFFDHKNKRYDFCKNSTNPESNKGERETDRGTPQVKGLHTSVTREQRRDLTVGDLVDGEVSAMAKSTMVSSPLLMVTPFSLRSRLKPDFALRLSPNPFDDFAG